MLVSTDLVTHRHTDTHTHRNIIPLLYTGGEVMKVKLVHVLVNAPTIQNSVDESGTRRLL